MRGAAIQGHGLARAPPAAVPLLHPRPRRAVGVAPRHRLRSDLLPLLLPTAAPFRARSPPSSSSSNVNPRTGEGADELLEELLQKHGEVVYSSGGASSASLASEADEDAECLSLAVSLAKVASEVKAADIRVLFVKPIVYWTEFFIILTAFSNAQIEAISSKMRDIGEQQFSRVASGDTKPNSWTLLDFGDVVVHIFLPPQREFYNLEEFYGNATPIELPFETQLQ
ncbi:hypothetical protein CFC21_072280 [Triticum aestivum]|uniref:Protein Iojap, chloroplastic n=3 Tax=Triticum TaxID=4564 RepID=A0A9R1AN29_TRITD|nr:protein Iojap, chloroplastic-like [Triticum dicoccoides]XP_044389384.1 protein Iojap, chloroplastic-like [Triticum aestivum]KAF7066266.1 hypothetical protein CFC21_072280 [Triticum aestivum]VAI33943.1 unnamed protein product [Triticum turgidum subsp. durum]